MPMPSVAMIENDLMTFYRYRDESRNFVERAVAPKDARLVTRLFDALEWKPIAVSDLTSLARSSLELIP